MKEISLLVGTRKGAFILRSDAAREAWAVSWAFEQCMTVADGPAVVVVMVKT